MNAPRVNVSQTISAAQVAGAMSAVCRECGGEIKEIESLFKEYLITPSALKISAKLKKVLFALLSAGIRPHARFLAKLTDKVQEQEKSATTTKADIEEILEFIRQIRSELGQISNGNTEPSSVLIESYRALCGESYGDDPAKNNPEMFMPFVPSVEFDWRWIPSKSASPEALSTRARQSAAEFKTAIKKLEKSAHNIEAMTSVRDSMIALEARNHKRSIMPLFDLSICAVDAMMKRGSAQVNVLKMILGKIEEMATQEFTAFTFSESLASRLFLILSDQSITGARIESLRKRYRILRGNIDESPKGPAKDVIARFKSALYKLTEIWKVDGSTEASPSRVYVGVKKIMENAHRMESKDFTRIIEALANSCERAMEQEQKKEFWTAGAMSVSLLAEIVSGADLHESTVESVLRELLGESAKSNKLVLNPLNSYIFKDSIRRACLEMLAEGNLCETMLNAINKGKGGNDLPLVSAKLRDVSSILRLIKKHKAAKLASICSDNISSGILNIEDLLGPLGTLIFHLTELSQDPSADDVKIGESTSTKENKQTNSQQNQSEDISMPDMKAVFLEEMREILVQIKADHDEVEISDTARQNIRRAFHTAKGASNVMGLSILGQACEEVQSTYDVVIDQNTAGFVLHELTALGIKRIESAVGFLEKNEPIQSSDVDLTVLAAEIRERSTKSVFEESSFDDLKDLEPENTENVKSQLLETHHEEPNFTDEEIHPEQPLTKSEETSTQEVNATDTHQTPIESDPLIDVDAIFLSSKDEIDSIDHSSVGYFIDEYDAMAPLINAAVGESTGEVDLPSLKRMLHTIKGAARVSGANQLAEAVHSFEGALDPVGSPNNEIESIQAVIDRLDDMVDEIKELQRGHYGVQEDDSEIQFNVDRSINAADADERAPLLPSFHSINEAEKENVGIRIYSGQDDAGEPDSGLGNDFVSLAVTDKDDDTDELNEVVKADGLVNLSEALESKADASEHVSTENAASVEDDEIVNLAPIQDEPVNLAPPDEEPVNFLSTGDEDGDVLDALSLSPENMTSTSLLSRLMLSSEGQFRVEDQPQSDLGISMDDGDILDFDGVIPAGIAPGLEKSTPIKTTNESSFLIDLSVSDDQQSREAKTQISVASLEAIGRASEEFIAIRSKSLDDIEAASKHADDLTSSIDRLEGLLRSGDVIDVVPASVYEGLSDMRGHSNNLADSFARIEDNEFRTKMIADDIAVIVNKMAMAPFSAQRGRIDRVLKHASRDMGIKTKLSLVGDASASPSMIDKLMPAIDHILRNSVAHGIENAEGRRLAGKSPEGLVRISLKQDSDSFTISIRDDGRGIDKASILAKAMGQGLVKDGENRAAEDFLFLPGFSTATEVTKLAGRGVGLDVVRADLLGMGGVVSVSSELGKWTEFTLKVPSDLSSLEIVTLTVDGYQVALPATMVDKIEVVQGEDLRDRVIGRSGKSERLVDMSHLLPGVLAPVDPETRSAAKLVTIGEATGSPMTLIVSEVGHTFKSVIRPLGHQVSSTQGLMAAAITAGGKLVLIVNPLRMRKADLKTLGPEPKKVKNDKKVVLIVDDSSSVRASHCRISAMNGWEPIQAKDGVEALLLLTEGLQADFMLLDIEMPNMDGLTLARTIRKSENKDISDIPIIMISSRVTPRFREQAAFIGVQGYLGKPCDASELTSIVDSLFAS